MATPHDDVIRAGLATRNWTPPEDQVEPYPLVAIKETQLVWVVQNNGQWAYVEFHVRGEIKTGHVPSNILQIGNPRNPNITFSLPEVNTLPNAPNKAVMDAGNTLLLDSDKDNKGIRNMLWGPHSQQYAAIVHKYMVPEAKKVMKDGKFSAADLFNKLQGFQPHHSKSKCFGIYVIIFQGAGPDNDKIAVYVGQTNDFERRSREHKQELQQGGSSRAQLYVLGRQASSYQIFPFVVFPNNAPEIPMMGMSALVHVAEFTMVCMFRSWNWAILYAKLSSTSTDLSQDFEYGRRLNGMMRTTLGQTGWNMARCMGLNWQTPILSDIHPEREWTMHYDPLYASYWFQTRRQLSVLRKKDGRIHEAYINWRQRSNCSRLTVPVRLVEAAGLEHGETVRLEVNICQNSNGIWYDHCVPYARVPFPCHNVAYEQLRSMGVQLQWVDKTSKKWKYAHLQATEARNFKKFGENCMIVEGLSLFTTLLQISYNNGPKWLAPLDRTRIRVVEFNHLLQQGRLNPMNLQGKSLDFPANRTPEDVMNQLKKLVPRDWQNRCVIGPRPKMDKQRSGCDLCASLADTVGCKYDEQSGCCSLCAGFGRPCTFSSAPMPAKGGNPTPINEFLKTDGPMQFFGIPSHMQSMDDKTSIELKREKRALVFEMRRRPFDIEIEGQIQVESRETIISNE